MNLVHQKCSKKIRTSFILPLSLLLSPSPHLQSQLLTHDLITDRTFSSLQFPCLSQAPACWFEPAFLFPGFLWLARLLASSINQSVPLPPSSRDFITKCNCWNKPSLYIYMYISPYLVRNERINAILFSDFFAVINAIQ